MKLPYAKELARIQDWINDKDRQLCNNVQVVVYQAERSQIIEVLKKISTGIQHEYPFYSQELLSIGNKLFYGSSFGYGAFFMNVAVFGQLYIIVKHISTEPINQRMWQDIHPVISNVSKDIFCDGYYPAAAEAAIKEVEAQMRILFKRYKPTAKVPKDAENLIGTLLSDNGVHKFCDTSEKSGENFRKGIQFIFEGAFSAFRNPNMHQNLPCSQREAFERITLASQMMYILSGEEANGVQ